jgi:hypothetical protein
MVMYAGYYAIVLAAIMQQSASSAPPGFTL